MNFTFTYSRRISSPESKHFLLETMNEIEKSTAYLATLEINNKQEISHNHNNLSKIMTKLPPRIITVAATGEFALPPDRVRLTLTIQSSKEVIEEAKQSVHRRFDYITQALKKNRIKVAYYIYFIKFLLYFILKIV